MVGIKILTRISNNNRLNRIRHIPTQIHTVINSTRFRDKLSLGFRKLKPLDKFVSTQNIIYALQKGINGEVKVLITSWYSWRRFFRSRDMIYVNVDFFDTADHKKICTYILGKYIFKLGIKDRLQANIIILAFKEVFEFTFETNAV